MRSGRSVERAPRVRGRDVDYVPCGHANASCHQHKVAYVELHSILTHVTIRMTDGQSLPVAMALRSSSVLLPLSTQGQHNTHIVPVDHKKVGRSVHCQYKAERGEQQLNRRVKIVTGAKD